MDIKFQFALDVSITEVHYVVIKCYIGQQKKRGIYVTVCKCGLFVNPVIPWLAATPDTVVEIGGGMGYLEVKCPFVCAKKSMTSGGCRLKAHCCT